MEKRLLPGLCVLAVFVLQGCAHVGEDAEVEVVMRGTAFEPREEVVPVGTTVVWVNEAGFDHTTTSEDMEWDSGAMADGDEYAHTFDEPGEYPYFCRFHQEENMTGTITVEEES